MFVNFCKNKEVCECVLCYNVYLKNYFDGKYVVIEYVKVWDGYVEKKIVVCLYGLVCVKVDCWFSYLADWAFAKMMGMRASGDEKGSGKKRDSGVVVCDGKVWKKVWLKMCLGVKVR